MFTAFLRYLSLSMIALTGVTGNDSQMQTGTIPGKGSEQRWQIKHPLNSGLPAGYVISGNNSFISVNQFYTQASHDGKTWENVSDSNVSISNYRVLGGVVFGNNKFVGAQWPKVFSSKDGYNWKVKRDTSANYFSSIAFGDSTFVIAGSKGLIMVSHDGEKWERHDTDTTIDFSSITFGNGVFVATCESPEQVMTSIDGITWSKTFTVDEHGMVYSVIYGNGVFLIVGPEKYRSSDGHSWQQIDIDPDDNVLFLNNQFISLSSSEESPPVKIKISRDLSTWTEIQTDLSLKDPLLTYLNGQYIAFDRSRNVCASKDLSNWKRPNSLTTLLLRDAAFGKGQFVTTGDSGTIITSKECSTWALASSLTKKNLNGIVYGNDIFVIVGDSGTILTSSDGKAWSKVNSGSSQDLNSIRFGNGLFVAASYRNACSVLVSHDGKTWAQYKTGGKDIMDLEYGNGKFVIAAYKDVFVSTDGKQWERSITGSGEFRELYFEDGKFIITGYDTEINDEIELSSDDGKWCRRTDLLTAYKKDFIPFGIGKCEIIDHQLFWKPSDSSKYKIESRTFSPVSVCFGNGYFVGVGENGKIAILRAQYNPDVQQKHNDFHANTEDFEKRLFVGEMNRQYVFLMTLTRNGKSLSGNYRYLRQNKSLKIEGTIDTQGVYYLSEYAEKGKTTGSFVGKMSDSEFIGEWRTPDSSKRLRIDGYVSSEAKIAERLKLLRDTYSSSEGIYTVVPSISGNSGANTMFDCSIENGDWKCSASSLNQGYREPIEDYQPEFDLDIINKIILKIDKYLSIELTVNGQRLLNIPLEENRLVYFGESATIARNIHIKELSSAGFGNPFVLTCWGGLESFSLDGNPALKFEKKVK